MSIEWGALALGLAIGVGLAYLRQQKMGTM